MFLVKLALKNLTRHKRRTLVTASVIALGLFMFVVIDSLMAGMEEKSFNNIIDLETGHIQLTHPAYWEEREQLPLENLFFMDPLLKETVQSMPHFGGMASRFKFPANLNNGVDELPIVAVGMEPAEEAEVLTIAEFVVEGKMPEPGEYQAVLGKSLADLMDLQIGDTLTLVLRTKDGTFNTLDAEIVGLLHTSHPTINDSMVFVPLNLAQQVLNLEGYVSEVMVRLEDKKYTETAAAELNQALGSERPDVSAHTWRESAQAMIAMGEAQDIENAVIISIILILAAAGIINTVILSALERLEETGMMKAMGMREREIIFVYVAEAAGIGLLGGIIGCALAALGVWLLTDFGIDLSWFGMGDFDWGIPIAGKFYGAWNFGAFTFSFFFGFAVALLSSILPARWAARKDPIKAIYHRGR